MKSIAERHRDIDYVLLTGDFPAHDIWRQSRKDNLASSKVVVDIVRKYFPSKLTLQISFYIHFYLLQAHQLI